MNSWLYYGKKMEQQTFKHIVRIANSDLSGDKPVYIALTKIQGISKMYSNMVCQMSGVDKHLKIGNLSQDQINKLNDVIFNPDKYNCPKWMMNRRADPVDGITKHLVSSDLNIAQENDIRTLKRMKCYKGIRHAFGLPLRGQRTKSNFRRNKGKAVGVRKRKGVKAGRV